MGWPVNDYVGETWSAPRRTFRTRPAEIEVAWEQTDLDQRPAVQIAIRDNGPGLDAEQGKRIFDPFYTTKTHGTGLGMALAKRTVEAHVGRIAVGSGSGGGAEIIITLSQE